MMFRPSAILSLEHQLRGQVRRAGVSQSAIFATFSNESFSPINNIRSLIQQRSDVPPQPPSVTRPHNDFILSGKLPDLQLFYIKAMTKIASQRKPFHLEVSELKIQRYRSDAREPSEWCLAFEVDTKPLDALRAELHEELKEDISLALPWNDAARDRTNGRLKRESKPFRLVGGLSGFSEQEAQTLLDEVRQKYPEHANGVKMVVDGLGLKKGGGGRWEHTEWLEKHSFLGQE